MNNPVTNIRDYHVKLHEFDTRPLLPAKVRLDV